MAHRTLLTHGTLVTPEGEIAQGGLLLEGGRITALAPLAELDPACWEGATVVNVEGAYLLPGLIDLHTDTLEKEVTPRPAADFPIEIAVQELDLKLVACGITTVYHSLHIGYQEAEWNNRSRYSRAELVEAIRAMAKEHTLARTRLHLRYETVGLGTEVYAQVADFVENGAVDLLSFMDHTPGQGQYTRDRFLAQRQRDGLSLEAAEKLLQEKQARPRVTHDALRQLAHRAIAQGIAIASHDDDSLEKVRTMRDLGVTISEFPINLAAATEAKAAGLTVLGGASNVLRGGSLTGNLDITEAIRAGVIHGLCSDYYPPAMLHAVFKLAREGILSLSEAVAMVSSVPARAVGLGGEVGSLRVGLAADVVVVRLYEGRPRVEQTYVGGHCVHQAGRSRSTTAALTH